jgi:hypothetical protein
MTGLGSVGRVKVKTAVSDRVAEFPIEPKDGQTVWHTGHRDLFYWDDVARKWVSLSRTFEAIGETSAGITNAYLLTPGLITMSSSVGFRVPYNSILTWASVVKGADLANNPTFEVRVDGVVGHSFTIGAANRTGKSSSFYVSAQANQVVSMFLNGTLTVGCAMMVGGKAAEQG